jgi:peroxiredoxin
MLNLKKPAATILLLFFGCCLQAQSPLAAAQLKTMRGNLASFSSITEKDSLILICFWATSSEVSINELNAINAKYEKWKKAAPFRLLAVAVDEGKSANRVKATANMNEWKFDVFTDINGELKKALNVSGPPQAMILRKEKVIYQQSGYEAGTEDYLFQKIQSIAAGRQ